MAIATSILLAMTPIDFPEANKTFVAPSEATDDQVMSIRAYADTVLGGSCDGWPQIVVAWRPTPDEVKAINSGEPIYLTFLSNYLPPHYLSMSFHAATHPA